MEEFMAGIVFGGLFAFPTGWFLKTAFVWRREAKKVGQQPESRPVSPPQQPAQAALESRLERMVELVNRRLEAMEDRMDFAERLLDARSAARLVDGSGGSAGEARRSAAPPSRAEGESLRR